MKQWRIITNLVYFSEYEGKFEPREPMGVSGFESREPMGMTGFESREPMRMPGFESREPMGSSAFLDFSKTKICYLCSKAFKDNWYLQRHMRTHTGERPYQCKFCERTFTQKGHLRVHMLKHLDMEAGHTSINTVWKPLPKKRHLGVHNNNYDKTFWTN